MHTPYAHAHVHLKKEKCVLAFPDYEKLPETKEQFLFTALEGSVCGRALAEEHLELCWGCGGVELTDSFMLAWRSRKERARVPICPSKAYLQ